MASVTHHIVYCTTHVVTGRYYIGVHSTTDLEDGYRGSGVLISKLLAKHPRNDFTCNIIRAFYDRESAEELEAMLVQDWLLDKHQFPLVMNLCPGGRGGVGKVAKSEAHRANMSRAAKARPRKTKPPKQPKPPRRMSDAERQMRSELSGGGACTIDGLTIFPSLRALAKALGTGKNGARSQSITYLRRQPINTGEHRSK